MNNKKVSFSDVVETITVPSNCPCRISVKDFKFICDDCLVNLFKYLYYGKCNKCEKFICVKCAHKHDTLMDVCHDSPDTSDEEMEKNDLIKTD